MPTTAEAVRLPFKEAVDYFRQKASVPSAHWTAVMDEAHARSFAVAGATDKALIGDLRGAVDKAIAEGTGLGAFQKEFDAIVAKHGWVHHGHPQWRARVIYESNMRTAFAAGRYAQATDPDVLAAFPYWEWVHTPVQHPRPQHVAWDGLVLRADDPFWDTHYPPCGYGCMCIVRSLSAGDLRRRGKSGPDASPKIEWREYVNKTTGLVTKVPTGVDPGWAYNPGKVWKMGAKAPVTAAKVVPVAPEPLTIPPARGFRSLATADQALRPAYREWAEGGSQPERQALAAYKAFDGIAMNRVLRGEADDPALAELAATLKGWMRRAEAPMGLELWRGVRQPELRVLSNLALGDVHKAKGFLSTTLVRARAEEFVGKSQVIVRIVVPKGTRGAAYVHPFPRVQMDQAEFLLNADMHLRMVEKSEARWTLLVENGTAAHDDPDDTR